MCHFKTALFKQPRAACLEWAPCLDHIWVFCTAALLCPLHSDDRDSLGSSIISPVFQNVMQRYIWADATVQRISVCIEPEGLLIRWTEQPKDQLLGHSLLSPGNFIKCNTFVILKCNTFNISIFNMILVTTPCEDSCICPPIICNISFCETSLYPCPLALLSR